MSNFKQYSTVNENTYLFFVIYCLVRQLLWSLVFNSTFNNSYNYMTASFIGGGNLAKSNDTEIQHKIGKQKWQIWKKNVLS